MAPELSPPPQSFLSWLIQALGYEYALAIPLASLVCLVLAILVSFRARGPMSGTALILIVPIPFVIGIFAGLEHAISALRTLGVIGGLAPEAQMAEGLSSAMVAPMVGLVMMVPGYGAALIGALIRSFRRDKTNGLD